MYLCTIQFNNMTSIRNKYSIADKINAIHEIKL